MMNTLRVILLTICVAIIAPDAVGNDEVSRIYWEVQHVFRDVEAWANGIPVTEASSKHSTNITMVSHFLRNGQNSLTLIWTKTASAGSPLSIEVLDWVDGQLRDQAKTLLKFEFAEDEPIGKKMKKQFELVIEHPFTWAWESAENIDEITPKDRTAIIELLRTLHKAFEMRNIKDVMRLTGLMFRETSLHRKEMVESVFQQYAKLMENPNWAMKPLQTDNLIIKAYGKMVRVSGPKAVIESKETGLLFKTIYFSKIRDEWIIVR